MNKIIPHTLVIVGPTASGKTSLSEALARELDGEIINADVGQLYAPLTIGTAKPVWQDYQFKAHLFDSVDQPVDINIMEYRRKATAALNTAVANNHTPIIVGGSLFYLKSLFFPAHELPAKAPDQEVAQHHNEINDDQLWAHLYTIDPERALALHRNDIYRIKRALTIWETTGVKPSAYKPEFNPVIKPFFICLDPAVDMINQRIDLRTQIMLTQGWVDEVRTLLDTPWEKFLLRKQLIGYGEIFEWIRNGEQNSQFLDLVKTIQIQTRQYAKRQRTFWRSFVRQLEIYKKSFQYNLISLSHQPSPADIDLIKKSYKEFIEK